MARHVEGAASLGEEHSMQQNEQYPRLSGFKFCFGGLFANSSIHEFYKFKYIYFLKLLGPWYIHKMCP